MSGNKFRALIRVLEVTPDKDLKVKLPGWAQDEVVTIPSSVLPEDLVSVVEAKPTVGDCDVYLHAHVNLGAESAAELEFAGPWELGKARVFVDRLHINPQGQVTDYGVEHIERRVWE